MYELLIVIRLSAWSFVQTIFLLPIFFNWLQLTFLKAMPTCSYCNKTFKDCQALGNHIRKLQYNSDDDLPLQN